jgi:hypothetical protein
MPNPISFGQTIPVTGPNIGFPGTISRLVDRIVAARVFMPFTSTNNLNFGDPAVLIENSSGGYWDSVADFVAHAASNIALVALQFAGMTVREVQTQLAYPVGQAPGILQVGYYASGNMAEVAERIGGGTILLTVGAPVAGSQVYTRIVQNLSNVPGTFIGDWETGPLAATDSFIAATGTLAIGGTSLDITNVNILPNQVVSGPGILPGTYVVSYTAGDAVLSQAVTQAILSGTPVTFSNLVALPNVVARTGYVDANNMLEITIKVRNAA